uniref:P protein n=1 Tax=Sonchus yellow net virus TaxID=11307 RepID=R9ZX38_SYNV|nr:P protein [Sonchus yellow net nucleorhabdovirus]
MEIDPNYVNPKYSSLKSTVMNSEVLTSKYKSAIHHAGDGELEDDILAVMEELHSMLQEKGLACHTENLEVFSSTILHLKTTGQENRAGDLIAAILSFGCSISAQAIVPSTLLKTMSEMLDSFATRNHELKLITKDLQEVVPRQVLKTKKKSKAKSAEGPSASTEDIKDSDTKGNQDIGDNGDLNSSINQRNREICYKHYTTDEFEALSLEKRQEIMKYYIQYILGAWGYNATDPTKTAMLYDLIDKHTVITVMRQSKEGTLTSDDILMAIDEVIDSVNSVSSCYGGYKATIGNDNGTPYLVLIPKEGVILLSYPPPIPVTYHYYNKALSFIFLCAITISGSPIYI